MGKYLWLGVLASICLACTACEKKQEGGDGSKASVEVRQGESTQGTSGEQGDGPEATGKSEGGAEPAGESQGERDAAKTGGAKKELAFLGDRSGSFLSETGYYYIEEDSQELKKDMWGRHIMYMDFATRKEVYLCNEPGCKHKDDNCTSVLSEEYGSNFLIFAAGDRLYIVSRDLQNEESMATYEIGEGAVDDKRPTAMYSMGLDGTDRKKAYTFEQDVTVDDAVLWDGEAMYFVAKKLSTKRKKGKAYTTASKRELVKISAGDFRYEKVCSLGNGNDVGWQIAGCCDGKVVLRGTKYRNKRSLQEEMEMEDKEFWEYSNDSREVYAWLDFADGSAKEIYSVKNDANSFLSTALLGDALYVSCEKTGEIQKVDLKTGKAKKLAKLKNGFIYATLSDQLCCQDWERDKDQTMYFVDVNSGKVSHSTLVNHCNGWGIDIVGEWKGKVLAVYDYDAKEDKEDQGAWEIYRYQFGLIDKKDLCQGRDRFQKIAMKGKGQ